jgi:uncharacterized protein (TIGR00730 family)
MSKVLRTDFSASANGSGWLKGVTVHTGSRPGTHPKYVENARHMGLLLPQNGFKTFCYGGGTSGTMGAAAQGAIAGGADVYDITLGFFADAQGHALPGVKQAIVVETMRKRMELMREMTEAAIVMPGSFGTMEEAFEWVTSRNGIVKPQIFVDLDGYWQDLRRFLKASASAGFRHPEDTKRIYVVPTPEAAIQKMLELNAAPATPEPEGTLIEGDWHEHVYESDHAYIVYHPAALTIIGQILTTMVGYDVSNIPGQTLHKNKIIKPFIFVGDHYKGLFDGFNKAITEGFVPPERRAFYHHARDNDHALEIAARLDSEPPLTSASLKTKHAEFTQTHSSVAQRALPSPA